MFSDGFSSFFALCIILDHNTILLQQDKYQDEREKKTAQNLFWEMPEIIFASRNMNREI